MDFSEISCGFLVQFEDPPKPDEDMDYKEANAQPRSISPVLIFIIGICIKGEDFRDLPNICAHPQATFHKPETSDLTYAPIRIRH